MARLIFEIRDKGKGIIEEIAPENLFLINEATDSNAIIHNQTTDKQGGDEELNQFYHFKQGEHEYLTEVVANDEIGEIKENINKLATPPTYELPISSINLSNAVYEEGFSANLNFIQIYEQKDGGPSISHKIIKNGTEEYDTALYIETLIVPLGTTTYSGKVFYSQGPCKENDLGVEDCNGRVEAGNTISPTKTITGALRRFAGSVDTIPADGAALRVALLGTSVINTGNNFTFTTGTVNRRFIIAVPDNKTLVNAKNTNTNEDLTFILSNTLTQVPNVAGALRNYKVYVLENAVPFGTNQTINVTLS